MNRRRLATVSLCVVLPLFMLSTLSIPFAFGFTSGEAAVAEVGQPNLTTGLCDDHTQPTPSDTSLCFSYAAAFDPAGNLWVADTSNYRIVEFPLSGGTVQSTESSVIGQPDFLSYSCKEGTTPTEAVCAPKGLAFDSHGNLWVADSLDSRVIEFPLVGGVIQSTATEVIGQASFSGFDCNQGLLSSAKSLCEPTGLAFDSSGNLWVADWDNSRILEFPLVSGAIATTASALIGQTTFNGLFSAGAACNQAGEGNPPAPPTAGTLCGPTTLAFDPSGNLWVADQSNSRVLEFPLVGGTIQPTASEVIGQADFFHDQANRGSSSPTASTLSSPFGVAFDPFGNLWVGDTQNERVLQFPLTGGSISTTADTVLGQSLFTTNLGDGGVFPAPVATGMSNPQALAFDSGGNLWVADEVFSRITEFAGTLPSPSPTTTTVNCAPDTVAVAGTTTCTATVSDGGQTPVGTVTWSAVAPGTGTVSFGSTTCTLSGGSCAVSVSGLTVGSGSVTVRADYGATAKFAASFGTESLTITGNPVKSTGVPEFSFGTGLLVAAAVPVMLLLRKKYTR